MKTIAWRERDIFKTVRLVFFLMMLFVSLLGITGNKAVAASFIERISGDNRIETAIQISMYGWEQAENVILARADNPADALSSASLSGALDAPILLTYPNNLSNSVLDEINRLGASTVYLLGGTGAISAEIEKKLTDNGLTVVRLGGNNRFETAAKINNEAKTSLNTKAIVVNGYAIADALSASSNSANNQIPIYLSMKSTLPVELPENITEVTIYGGEGVVDKNVVTHLNQKGIKVTRIGGSTRYETNINAADLSKNENVIIVRGTSTKPNIEDYPDAVAGAGLSQKLGANIILSHDSLPISVVANHLEEQHYPNVYVLGGPGAVSDEVIDEITFFLGSKVEKTFDFNVIDAVIDPINPVIYLLSDDDNSVKMYNYNTQELKSIMLNARPEQIYFENNKIYITLVHGLHSSYWWDEDQTGEIAIVNADTFKLEKSFSINLDPFDIVVDKDGYIYVSGGSGQWTDIKSYSPDTGLERSSYMISERSYLEMHPSQSKVYAIDTSSSPRDITQFFIKDGKFTGKMDSPYHGDYDLGDIIKASPDGGYLFNDFGNVFTGNLSYAAQLEVPFNDLAFDLDQNRFFSGIENVIFEYDYSTFEIYNYYVINGEAIKTFYKDGKMYILSSMTVSSTGLQEFTLESLTPEPVFMDEDVSSLEILESLEDN
ncbi:cell wall-binding repeat-containing protein [Neobacillus sp. YX16]|uniref:cell wall-binding repeat-containing protein n=1 Tax=Neobacillus sp. YX16 TaxID=3047874 RepID=UPI0024C3B44C|nr:cell wall-binding repeat-containing protein [Neobacillus sp. YX16]WHZ02393.1 cell wall-binding repeat-containing protein [Neobacillus sp. YX16]